jgi:homoserine kinase
VNLTAPARAFAPATVGNVACGFDVFGLALGSPGDVVAAWERDEPGAGIRSIVGDGGRLPWEPHRNCASVAADAVLRRVNANHGVELELHKGLPLSGGMGGSAASSVAAAVAVHALIGGGLSRVELLGCALEGERQAAGAAHPDNAAPALLGGIVLVRAADPPDLVELPVPPGMSVALVHPQLEVETREAREALGETLSLAQAVIQWGNTAAFAAGLYREDWDLIARSLVDVVAEPVRSRWVPGFEAVKAAALEAGALGCSLSGSGPSLFALCRTLEVAGEVGAAMRDAFMASARLPSDAYASEVDRRGARVLSGAGGERP